MGVIRRALCTLLMYWFLSNCDYVVYDYIRNQYLGFHYGEEPQDAFSYPEDSYCYELLAGPMLLV